ncbi:MAG: tetratricopeptide repeat protein [bacterium]
MEKNAVLFAGTDDARFVSTYMVFCESHWSSRNQPHNKDFDRSDVYLLAQNALADATYMSALRDQYDFDRPTNTTVIQRLLGRDRAYPLRPILIPSAEDNTQAFRQYVADVQADRDSNPANPSINVTNGRIRVRGVGGVMHINGILAHWIFTRNKDQHPFYVEESYGIPWMYPNLQPAGIIMKLGPQPLPSPQENPQLWREIIDHDRAYWDQLASMLMARGDFRRNEDAKKCFSHLRGAIAGLYVFREMNADAEYAFRQALQLDPGNSESHFRLADLYLRQQRYAEARALMNAYQKLEPADTSARDFLASIAATEKDHIRRQDLEKRTPRSMT